MNTMNEYRHTQRSPFVVIFAVFVIAAAVTAAINWNQPEVAIPLACFAAFMAILVFTFGQLTVIGEENGLRLQYGVIPLIAKRFPYAKMNSVASSRSKLIDGWGIHYIPTRGWTYNIWGFDCVQISREGHSAVRIGTDDVEGLLHFLETKIANYESGQQSS